ncbi:MAG: Eco57I restriction-modification methylase domain-containing protein [Aeriscardovia sp.]|nr:Eco57I restriction-modification methylase domain-containing protein [Aeriscardovia sp.]
MNYKEVIESKYNRENWQILLHDIFGNKIKFWNTPSPVQTNSQFARKALWLGTITLSDEQTIAVYEVELSDNVDIERNRRGIRDMLLSSWRNNGNAGAFMFCYRKYESVLRFSYVSESWTFGEDGTYKKESTDTKRFTYLLGEGHRSRTAIQQFEKLRDSSLSLKDLTKAFSVDAVSDMFFKGYKQQYEDIIYYVTGKRMVKVSNKWEERQEGKPNAFIMQQFAKFPNPEKAVRDYVKKLMGRLVFLQFLQKKGWLGVPVDKEWGEGDSEFIQTLFAECKDKDHFIDNELESLFTDLNTEREGNLGTPSTGGGRGRLIPYLNGGLFERDASDETEFPLPAKYMQSLLDFFASYNFTIDENDPDDAEVGVDPEMLGRIFENLLEDNKDKGAFYTPKEIVSYMCRESLIAYLQTDIEDETTKEAIRQFVTTHNSKHLGSKASPLWERLEGALRDVKICDPAIGSGAFPMGLLKELFQCRTALEGIEQSKAAEIKKHIIQQNIYGVDIERGAVDIARLRFWLSLIVDEETPQALPNLDFKIMQGNSLLEQYKGVDLSTMTEKKYDKKEGLSWFDDMVDVYRKELCDMLAKYYDCTDHKEKKELRTNIINNVKKQLAEQSINVNFGDLDLSGNDQFFLWHTWFYDVFSQGGFDIVIGNPPYVDSETMVKVMHKERELYARKYSCARGNWDMFIVFVELGNLLLKENGIFSNIIPNKLIASKYGIELRKLLSSKHIIEIRDYSRIDVFEDAAVYPITIVLRNSINKGNTLFTTMKNRTEIKQSNLAPSEELSKRGYWDPFFADSPIFKLISKISSYRQLKELPVEVLGAATVADAYEIKNLVQDDCCIEGFKLVNSGTIDPYVTYWGVKQCRYLKDSYVYPKVPSAKLKTYSSVRYKQASSTKIIVASMTTKYEASLDVVGEYIAGKSTTIIIGDKNELYKLTAIINSKLASYWLNIVFNSLKMSGGAINIGKNELQILPIPECEYNFESLVQKIIDKKTSSHSSDTSALESEIDRIVYQLYGLTGEEIAIVEKK